VVDEELLALLTSISTHEPAYTALRTEGHEGSQSDDSQTGVGKRGDYIVRSSLPRCNEPSVVDVWADTIKSPISRIFDGKFRMTSQDDTVQVESWRTLQLDIQVCSFTFRTFRRLGDLSTNPSDSLIQYTIFKMHSPSFHSQILNRSSHLTRAKRANKSRCSSKHFHLYSSSISSASMTTQSRVA
jgi:hypothetical protein